ncbi:hypothetical protein ACKWMY_20130 [Serratia sp. J2]|uniref:hypothetical protein n=1 Tax=Serratia sp. J2 TaxID=3386551 RepID=UPI003916D476
MKLKKLLICAAIIILSGCDSGTPKCNSDEAKNLVVDIASKPYADRPATRYTAAQKVDPVYVPSITVSNVRTQQHNSNLDIYLCAADVNFTYSKHIELNSSRPITYRIQKTDDNNGQFYINVFGL